jgi:hypothetical protein
MRPSLVSTWARLAIEQQEMRALDQRMRRDIGLES